MSKIRVLSELLFCVLDFFPLAPRERHLFGYFIFHCASFSLM